MKTDILHYQVDLKGLLKVQSDEQLRLVEQKKVKEETGLKNKKELLKYVLPFMHGVLALHNNKCDSRANLGKNCKGLLGFGKKDIQKALDLIVASENNITWTRDFTTFETSVGDSKIRIWLNSSTGAYVANKNLPYSMTGFGKHVYGESVETELVAIAKHCASKYTDEWPE